MKTIDNINLIVADKLGIDKNIVKKVNSIYWKSIKHKASYLEDTTISVKGAFNFTISRYLTRKMIVIIIRKIQAHRKSTKFKPETWERIYNGYCDYLRRLLKQRNEVAKIIYEQNNRISQLDSQSSEKSNESIGGSSEQGKDESQFA